MEKSIILGLVLLLGTSLQANADAFDFDFTFDGTSISVDAGSINPVGTVLFPGDSFTVDVRARGNDFWRVQGSYVNALFPLTFTVSPIGTRTGSAEAVFFLDGAEVARVTEANLNQAEDHIGAQQWSLSTDLEFDTVSMVYNLFTATDDLPLEPKPFPNNISTTINPFQDFFLGVQNFAFPFFRDDRIEYVSDTPISDSAGDGDGWWRRNRRRQLQ